jgi:hypothetical protein
VRGEERERKRESRRGKGRGERRGRGKRGRAKQNTYPLSATKGQVVALLADHTIKFFGPPFGNKIFGIRIYFRSSVDQVRRHKKRLARS